MPYKKRKSTNRGWYRQVIRLLTKQRVYNRARLSQNLLIIYFTQIFNEIFSLSHPSHGCSLNIFSFRFQVFYYDLQTSSSRLLRNPCNDTTFQFSSRFRVLVTEICEKKKKNMDIKIMGGTKTGREGKRSHVIRRGLCSGYSGAFLHFSSPTPWSRL